MWNLLCCSYAFCCQQNCHILGFYRRIRKGTLLKMDRFSWEKGFRLQLSPVWKCCLEDWLFCFPLDQSIPMLPFFYRPPQSEFRDWEICLCEAKKKRKKETESCLERINREWSFTTLLSSSLKAVLKCPSTSVRTRQRLLSESQSSFGVNTPVWNANNLCWDPLPLKTHLG